MPTLWAYLDPLACLDLKNQGAIGRGMSEIVGIDVYFIKIGQGNPEICLFVT